MRLRLQCASIDVLDRQIPGVNPMRKHTQNCKASTCGESVVVLPEIVYVDVSNLNLAQWC